MEKTSKKQAKPKKEKAAKAPKRSLLKRTKNKSLSTYSSLVHRKKVKNDKKAKQRAEDLATLPKQPVKRFFAHFHPKRVFHYWFSMRGLKMFLKIVAVLILLNRTVLHGMIFEGAAVLLFILPPPYIIPVFADEPNERVQISSSLSALTLVTMVLFATISVFVSL